MPASNPYDYLQAKNAKMVELLDRNHNVSGFIYALLHHLVEHCDAKGIKFEDVILDQPFIGDDEYLRTRITVNYTT